MSVCSQLCIFLYSGPRYNVDDIPVEKLHLERALDDDSAAEGVTGHRVTVAISVTRRTRVFGDQTRCLHTFPLTLHSVSYIRWYKDHVASECRSNLQGYMHDENKLIKKKYKAR